MPAGAACVSASRAAAVMQWALSASRCARAAAPSAAAAGLFVHTPSLALHTCVLRLLALRGAPLEAAISAFDPVGRPLPPPEGAPPLAPLSADLVEFGRNVPLGAVVDGCARGVRVLKGASPWSPCVVVGERRDAGVLRRFLKLHALGTSHVCDAWVGVGSGAVAPLGLFTG